MMGETDVVRKMMIRSLLKLETRMNAINLTDSHSNSAMRKLTTGLHLLRRNGNTVDFAVVRFHVRGMAVALKNTLMYDKSMTDVVRTEVDDIRTKALKLSLRSWWLLRSILRRLYLTRSDVRTPSCNNRTEQDDESGKEDVH